MMRMFVMLHDGLLHFVVKEMGIYSHRLFFSRVVLNLVVKIIFPASDR